MIVDAHIHIWDFEKATYAWLNGDTTVLNRTYSIDDIETERRLLGITGGVLVQAANNLEDTNWMLEVAEQTGWINAVVGWLPLMDPGQTNEFINGKFAQHKYFKGIRHLIHDEPDAKWLLQTEVIESLQLLAAANITYDVVGVLPQHIETVLKVAEKVPGLNMIFDHLNHPRVNDKSMYIRWKEMMKVAAQHQRFFAKISGLGTACGGAGFTEDDVKPAIEFALETFDIDHCCMGGDWPVALLAGSYTKTWTTYKNIIDGMLSPQEAEKVYCTNAQEFYRFT